MKRYCKFQVGVERAIICIKLVSILENISLTLLLQHTDGIALSAVENKSLYGQGHQKKNGWKLNEVNC